MSLLPPRDGTPAIPARRAVTAATAATAATAVTAATAAHDEGPRRRPWGIEGCGSAPFPITTSVPEVPEWFDQANALLRSFWLPAQIDRIGSFEALGPRILEAVG